MTKLQLGSEGINQGIARPRIFRFGKGVGLFFQAMWFVIVAIQPICRYPDNHWGLSINSIAVPALLLQTVVWLAAVGGRCSRGFFIASALIALMTVAMNYSFDWFNILVPYDTWVERGMPEFGASINSGS